MNIFHIKGSYKLIENSFFLTWEKDKLVIMASKYLINMKNKPSLSSMIKEIKLKHYFIYKTDTCFKKC